MRKTVLFDEFSYQCPFFNSDTDVNNGYGCNHPEQIETREEKGKKQGCCYCHTCPLGIEAEQQDLTDKEHEIALGDYTIGRYAWVLEGVDKLPRPVPAKGRQGLWNWNPSNIGR